ncbi:hypothetical protein DFO62_12661 [Serratia fonticola]|nr:hypothetical protein DFO62_12661 [Serratia fonticola]
MKKTREAVSEIDFDKLQSKNDQKTIFLTAFPSNMQSRNSLYFMLLIH